MDISIEQVIENSKSESPGARRCAAEYLAETADPRAIGILAELLRDGDTWVSEAAAESLGEIGKPEALSVLIDFLRREKDSCARGAVGKVLIEIADPELLERLPSFFENDLKHENGSIRSSAAEVLGLLGNPSTNSSLIEALNDEDEVVRFDAMEALTRTGDSQAIGLVINALVKELRNEENRHQAVEALGETRDKRAIPALATALHDKVWFVREAAVDALKRIGDPQTIELLTQTLSDKVYDVRRAAIEMVTEIGDEETRRRLILPLPQSAYWRPAWEIDGAFVFECLSCKKESSRQFRDLEFMEMESQQKEAGIELLYVAHWDGVCNLEYYTAHWDEVCSCGNQIDVSFHLCTDDRFNISNIAASGNGITNIKIPLVFFHH